MPVTSAAPSIGAATSAATAPLPLTGSQRGIVAAGLVDPGAADFVVGEVLHLTGLTGAGASDGHALLRAAVEQTIADTPWLGWRLEENSPTSRLVPGAPPLVRTHDLRDVPNAASRVLAAAREDTRTPLDPAADAQTRIGIWTLGDDAAAVSFVVHHLLLDGYGVHLVLRRILRTYLHLAGHGPRPGPWADPARVVADEETYLRSDRAARDRAFWDARPPHADAATAFRLPRVPAEGLPATRVVPLVTDLDEIARAFDATFVEVLAAAHAIVLSRWSGTREVVIGIPLMNRTGSAAAQAPTCTVNVLPLAVHVDPAESPRALVARIAADLGALRRHGRLRAEELLARHGHLAAGTTATGTELNVKLFDAPPTAPGMRAEIVNLAEGPLDDVDVAVLFDGTRPTLRLAAPAGTLVDDLAALGRAFGDALDDLAAGADENAPLGRLAARVRVGEELSVASGESAEPVHPTLLGRRLAEAAAAHPERPALVHRDTSWDHARLFDEVVRRTAVLAARTAADQPLVLDLPRDPDGLAWYLAATASGRAGVPIDTGWPRARKDALVAHLEATARRAGTPEPRVLTRAEADDWLSSTATTPAEEHRRVARRTWARLDGSSPAYVIHTSGSTGAPKPVLIGQAALARHLQTYGSRMWTDDDAPGLPHVAALTLPLVFDGSWDMLSALTWGHTVLLVDHDVAQDPRACVAQLRAQAVTAIDSTPTVVAALLEEGLLEEGHTLTRLNVGGEACPRQLWERLGQERTRTGAPLRAHNYYGPTESTVDATRLASRDDGDRDAVVAARRFTGGSPIGRGVEGTATFVLDPWLRPVPHGIRGELYLAGEQLAHGYLGMPGRTAERFVANPFGSPGSRLYRTGDLVRMLPGGHLVYEGRGDEQLKVRGYRLEPREVEAGLESLAEVRQALARSDGTRLLAWVVPTAGRGAAPSGDELRERAAAVLPDHLLPAAIVPLAAFPRTATGKIDVGALPAPAAGDTGRAPESPAETALAAAFAEVLDTARPGAEADFFRLGGDSIRAIRLVSRMREAGFTTSVSHIFAQRTLARIARTCTPAPAPGAGTVRAVTPPPFATDPGALAAVTALLRTHSTRPEGRLDG